MGRCKRLQCFRAFSVAVRAVCSVTGAARVALAKIMSGALALVQRSMRRATPASDATSRSGARTSRSRLPNIGTSQTSVGPARNMSESNFGSMRRATMYSQGLTSPPQRCSDHGITVPNSVQQGYWKDTTAKNQNAKLQGRIEKKNKGKGKGKGKADGKAGGKGGGKGKGKEGKGKGAGKGDGKGKGKGGKGKEGKGTGKKLPDWQCTQCDSLNRHYRDECYKLSCQASKIGNSKTVAVLKTKKQTVKFVSDDEPRRKKHKAGAQSPTGAKSTSRQPDSMQTTSLGHAKGKASRCKACHKTWVGCLCKHVLTHDNLLKHVSGQEENETFRIRTLSRTTATTAMMSEKNTSTVSEQPTVPELLYSDSDSSQCSMSKVDVASDVLSNAGDKATPEGHELNSDTARSHTQTVQAAGQHWNRQRSAARKFFRGRVDVSSIKIVRINNFVEDKLRPRDTKLVDSGAEINIERDLRRFVQRLQESKIKINFADGSDSLKCEGYGLCREWYYDRRGNVYVDEYYAYYCPKAEYSIRSEQDLVTSGWRVIRNPTEEGGLFNFKGERIAIPALIKNPANPNGPRIHDPDTGNDTHLLNPKGRVLITKRYGSSKLEWLQPIQADGHTDRVLPNSHASVRSKDATYPEIVSSLRKLRKVAKEKEEAEGQLDGEEHPVNSVESEKTDMLRSDSMKWRDAALSDDPADFSLVERALDEQIDAYMRARSAKFGCRTEEVSLAMLELRSAFDSLREFDSHDAGQTYDSRDDTALHYDDEIKTVDVCSHCRKRGHTATECKEACWSCHWVQGHADDCENQHVAVATVAIPATESVVVRSDMHQDELDHEQALLRMATEAHVLVNSTSVSTGTQHKHRKVSGTGSKSWDDSSRDDTKESVPAPAKSILLDRDEIKHVAHMLRLNEHDDTQNYHLDDDGDPTTLQAFKDLYSERLPETKPSGKPGWNLSEGSSRRTAAAKTEVGTLQSWRRPGAGVGSNPEDDSETSDESKGEGVDHSGRTKYCTECSTLCPETNKAGHYQCATCEVVFTSRRSEAYVASSSVRAASKATSEKKQRDTAKTGTALVESAHADKTARKRTADDCEQTAEDLLQTKAALLRNLTTPLMQNGDLSTVNGMPPEEWWYYLNTNEQLALAVRAKVLGVTHKATSIALEKAREAINHHKDVGKKSTREKKEAALAEYSERLAQHKRAKSEFENTINLVTSSMYDVVDPGSQTHAKDGMSRYELEKRMQKETPQLGKSRSI